VLSGVRHDFEGRRIASQEITPIARLGPGPAAISGTARPADEGPLSAPLTERECVAATHRISETAGKDDAEPFLAEGTESVPFYADDGAGEVLVRPDATDICLETDTEIVVERDEQPPEPIARFPARRDDIGEVDKRPDKEFGETTVEITRGAEGGQPKPRTFIGIGSLGIGAGMLLGTPLV
jgi:hypothetical protein